MFIDGERDLAATVELAQNHQVMRIDRAFAPGRETGVFEFRPKFNRSPAKVAEMESSHLNKSAYSIKRRDGSPAFDKINESFKADRFSDLRQKDKGN